MKLHEIELYSDKPEEAREFYASILALQLQVDQQRPKVFNAGIPGVALNISNHNPASKISLSFLVKHLEGYIATLRERQIELEPINGI